MPVANEAGARGAEEKPMGVAMDSTAARGVEGAAGSRVVEERAGAREEGAMEVAREKGTMEVATEEGGMEVVRAARAAGARVVAAMGAER